MKIHPALKYSSILLIAVFVAGCGKKDGAAPATQVAAKVNAEEITVHQINSALARSGNLTPEAAERAKKEILNRLVEQQIAKQQAVDKKLDRKPEIMQALEGARNEILARAYLESIASAQPKPTPEEVKKYYADHPELFARRRVYNLQELVVPATEGLAPKLEAQVAKARTIEEVGAWLTAQNIKFAANRGTRAAEALPITLVAKLEALKEGGFHVVAAGNSLTVIRVAGSQLAPVTESVAAPRIQQFLLNQRASEAVAAEMKRLRDKTEISYLGEFSAAGEEKKKADAEAKAKELEKAKADTDLAAKARAEAKAKLDAETQAKADELARAREARLAEEAKSKSAEAAKGKGSASKAIQVDQEKLEKGLRGLK